MSRTWLESLYRTLAPTETASLADVDELSLQRRITAATEQLVETHALQADSLQRVVAATSKLIRDVELRLLPLADPTGLLSLRDVLDGPQCGTPATADGLVGRMSTSALSLLDTLGARPETELSPGQTMRPMLETLEQGRSLVTCVEAVELASVFVQVSVAEWERKYSEARKRCEQLETHASRLSASFA